MHTYVQTAVPVVKFSNGIERQVKAEKWVIKTGTGGQVTRTQLPLQLAWAISIHKSQIFFMQYYTLFTIFFKQVNFVAIFDQQLANNLLLGLECRGQKHIHAVSPDKSQTKQSVLMTKV